MKCIYALAIWLAAGGCAWAANQGTSPAPGTAYGWQSSSSGSNQPAPAAEPDPSSANPAAQTGEVSLDDKILPPAAASTWLQPVQEAVNPMRPGEIRTVREDQYRTEQAFAAPMVSVVPRISAQTVDLSPGASPPLVRTAMDYPSSIAFMDSTGAPWKIGAMPLSGNPSAFRVDWVPNSPLMVITAIKPFSSGLVIVVLEGLSVPLTLSVTSGETDSTATTWQMDSRLDLRLPRRGPAARVDAVPETRIALHDSILQGFLDGVPPKDARRLKTTGSVPGTTVWQLGDDLYVRSTSEIRDEFEATLSSADGTHLWKLPLTPYLSFSVMGRTTALNVALE